MAQSCRFHEREDTIVTPDLTLPRLTPNASNGVSVRTLSRVLAGFLALLVGTGGLLYVNGMHTARPIATVITRNNALSRSRRLVVFVKGGSADMDTYSPLLDRLRREPELANADLLLFDHQLARLTIGHEYDFATRLRRGSTLDSRARYRGAIA